MTTPVHIFTVTYADGSTRRKAVPGRYTEVTRASEYLKGRLPKGAKITSSTWRSDYRYMDQPANLQPDYQAHKPSVCALLAYYDESTTWLREMVDTLRLVGVTQLVAVDGAYRLYPGGTPTSPQETHKALRQACQRNKIILHHHAPEELWADEMAKRSFIFAFAEQWTTPEDFYFVVDADERVTHAPKNVLAMLAGHDVGECVLYDKKSQTPLRMFFRAIRGLRVVNNHYTYQAPDGRRLWGDWNDRLEPAVVLPVRVEHRDEERSPRRRDAKFGYYNLRDKEEPEQHVCAWCSEPSSKSIPWNWRRYEHGLVGERVGVCDGCYPVRMDESIAQAAELGADASHLARGTRAFR